MQNIVIYCFHYTYIDHEINLKILEFIINSIEKVKSDFFYLSQYVCFLNKAGQNPNLTACATKIQVFCRPEGAEGVGTHENEY